MQIHSSAYAPGTTEHLVTMILRQEGTLICRSATSLPVTIEAIKIFGYKASYKLWCGVTACELITSSRFEILSRRLRHVTPLINPWLAQYMPLAHWSPPVRGLIQALKGEYDENKRDKSVNFRVYIEEL